MKGKEFLRPLAEATCLRRATDTPSISLMAQTTAVCQGRTIRICAGVGHAPRAALEVPVLSERQLQFGGPLQQTAVDRACSAEREALVDAPMTIENEGHLKRLSRAKLYRTMKILYSQKLTGIAGSERYLLSLLPMLVGRGHQLSFLMIRPPGLNADQLEFISALAKSGIQTHEVECDRLISPGSVWRFGKIVKDVNPDILQTNLIHADMFGALATRWLRDPPILVSTKHGYSDAFQSAHGFDSTKVRLDALSAVTWGAARYADAVVSISNGLAKFLTESRLVARAKSRAIPYGFDFSDAPSVAPPGALRLGLPQIVSVSRLVPVKQLDVLIDAIARLAPEFPQLHLVLVGDGPLRGSLEQHARGLGVADRVAFVGFKPNVLDYIRDSDVFALSSAAEGFGRVILEAWWHAKPVVCFDVPAPNEIITDDHDGLLVPPRDPSAFAEALRRLLQEPQLARRLGENGRRTYDENYRIAIMANRTIALYQELLDLRRSSSMRDPTTGASSSDH